MAQGEKPYRVYRGGRVKGRVPTIAKPEHTPPRRERPPAQFKGPGPSVPKKKGERNWGRWIGIGLVVFSSRLFAACAPLLSAR